MNTIDAQQLSGDAQRILSSLPESGHASNLRPLADRLALPLETLHALSKELASQGFVRIEGNRIRRVHEGTREEAGLSVPAEKLFQTIPTDGSALSNLRLRSRVDLSDDQYTGAKQELLDAGLVRAGPGRGGTLARVQPHAPESVTDRAASQVAKESELYEPFARWVRSSLQGQGQEQTFLTVHVTANFRKHKKIEGKWLHPDVTAVTVSNFEYLPGASIEVLTYEIKRAGVAGASRLESVYEAAAHGRWGHRASLVVEALPDEAPVPEAVYGEIERFGLGLYSMRRQANDWDIHELREPDAKTPESWHTDELLGDFFADHHHERMQYLNAIKG